SCEKNARQKAVVSLLTFLRAVRRETDRIKPRLFPHPLSVLQLQVFFEAAIEIERAICGRFARPGVLLQPFRGFSFRQRPICEDLSNVCFRNGLPAVPIRRVECLPVEIGYGRKQSVLAFPCGTPAKLSVVVFTTRPDYPIVCRVISGGLHHKHRARYASKHI